MSAFCMIVVSVFTDVYMSTALIYEKAEDDIMSRPPRNLQGDRLVNAKLLFYAYGVIGTLQTISAWFIFLWYMNEQGVSPSHMFLAFDKWPTSDDQTYVGKSGKELNEALNTAQTLFFVTLVILQFFNALSVRTRKASIFQQNPFWGEKRNLRILAAEVCAIATMIFVTLLPWFQDTFNTRYAPVQYAIAAVGFGAFILCFDETRKYIVRNYPHSIIAKLAW